MIFAQPADAPVRLHGKVLFQLRVSTPELSAREAANLAVTRIERLAANRSIDTSTIHVQATPSGQAIVAGESPLVLVTPNEAAAQQRSLEDLASEWAARIREAVDAHRATNSFRFWAGVATYAAVYVVLFAAALWLLYLLHRKARSAANHYTQTHLPERGSRWVSLFTGAAIFDAFISVLSIVRWVLTLVLFNFFIIQTIRLFPGTDEISQTLGSYLLSPLYLLGAAIVAYLPNLFFVLLVALVAVYLVRLCDYIFTQIARGVISIDGFYADWAIPTARLTRLLILALAVIVAFPYLPGANSPAFQGISIFVGVLVSLGSSSTISNVISGVILTYTRAFQIGDRVNISSTIGDVVEKNLLVTRVQTIRNEIVTIPNSQIMSAQIMNYSLMAREGRLILHTAVTIGYDAPWKQVHQLLLDAAVATTGVAKTPAPFVWQRALNDYNVTYELNVHTGDARAMVDIYSALHGNIQDHFNRAGVEIMSPAFTAIRDGNTVTIPASQRPAGYEPPGFRMA